MFKTILAAYDGSDHSKKALELACDLAQKYDAALHVAAVPQIVGDVLLAGYSATPLPPTAEEISKAKETLTTQARDLATKAGNANVTIHVTEGDPAHVIVEKGKECGCDLIVMGRRGLGQWVGLLVGSTTNKVSQLAECAVLTVK